MWKIFNQRLKKIHSLKPEKRKRRTHFCLLSSKVTFLMMRTSACKRIKLPSSQFTIATSSLPWKPLAAKGFVFLCRVKLFFKAYLLEKLTNKSTMTKENNVDQEGRSNKRPRLAEAKISTYFKNVVESRKGKSQAVKKVSWMTKTKSPLILYGLYSKFTLLYEV